MRYESEDGRIVEYLWNSRDGVTPFGILARDGTTMLRHAIRHMEFRPNHQPQAGDRIFVDMPLEIAIQHARERLEKWPELRELYPTEKEKFNAIQTLAKGIFAGGKQPMITIVE